MTINVGIDVSKHSFEWCVGSEGAIQHARNEPRPIAQLTRRLVEMAPERIVVESTGGYERALVLKLAEAGLPWGRCQPAEAPGHPQRDRQRKNGVEGSRPLTSITIAC